MQINVIKRDGTKVPFDFSKIKNAVNKAFQATYQSDAPEEFLDYLQATSATFQNEMSVEDIQKFVIYSLGEFKYYDVQIAYIKYKENRDHIRDFAQKKIDFIKKYEKSDNTANATIDDNANVANHNIAVLNAEIHKPDNQETNLKILENKVKELYPDFDYKQMRRDFDTIGYLHDSSSQIGMPYTYSCKEVIEVLYNGKKLLVPFDLLYNIIDEPEVLIDSENIVYQKYPWHLYVKDLNNEWTQVSVITKKQRHRPLVRVKTAFGEDVVVTDNHPMIYDIENIENTVEAKDSINKTQYRIGTKIEFKGKTEIDLVDILPTWVEYTDTFLKYQQAVIRRHIQLNRALGYIVGFFVGDGGYNNTCKTLDFSQKEKETLENINSILFNEIGVVGTIRRDSTSGVYTLRVANQYLYELFRGYFKIQDKAQNKILPYNILEFNEEFAKGCLEGLIDADGTIKYNDCCINIRLSSRSCILQCTALFRYFGYSVGNSMQSLPFSNNPEYHTNYTI